MKKYNIKSHPTSYGGVNFRSRLEARWAAFFDLVGWKWEYEPIDLNGWVPDFRVQWECGHSECNGSHSLLVEIKPYRNIKDFEGHPCMHYIGCGLGACEEIDEDSSAAFGINPSVIYFGLAHGAGGGEETDIRMWASDIEENWNKAGNIVQWKGV